MTVLHFHWIERYYTHWRGSLFTYITLTRFVLFLFFAKVLAYRIVWTMHNVAPHESTNRLADRLAVLFMARISSVVVHCENARKLLLSIARPRRVEVIPHGNYLGVYPMSGSREEARGILGMGSDVKMFLYFGLVRVYKGVGELCEAFSSLRAKKTVLMIAGKPYEEKEKEMVENLIGKYSSESIMFEPRFIPNDTVWSYFAAADFAVFPYRDVLTSGSVILSLGCGCPVIVPAIGCLEELSSLGVGIVYDPDDPEALRGAMMEAIGRQDRDAMSQRCLAYAESLNWDGIARAYHLYMTAREDPERMPPRGSDDG